jgi:hypothetical protein
MMADGEAGAQVSAAAAKMDQARMLFEDAVKMVRQSPLLAERITPSGVNPVYNLADLCTGSSSGRSVETPARPAPAFDRTWRCSTSSTSTRIATRWRCSSAASSSGGNRFC